MTLGKLRWISCLSLQTHPLPLPILPSYSLLWEPSLNLGDFLSSLFLKVSFSGRETNKRIQAPSLKASSRHSPRANAKPYQVRCCLPELRFPPWCGKSLLLILKLKSRGIQTPAANPWGVAVLCCLLTLFFFYQLSLFYLGNIYSENDSIILDIKFKYGYRIGDPWCEHKRSLN